MRMDQHHTGLSQPLLSKIEMLAKSSQMDLVILFGSRARGDFKDKSDIDLAVSGRGFTKFILALDEETPTLLQYDVVNLDRDIDDVLLQEIQRDGIVLYRKEDA